MILVIIANSNTCRFYHYVKQPAKLMLIKEFSHLENKLKDSELTASKPGKYQGTGGMRGAYSPASDPKENKIDVFLREVANELNHERTGHEYEQLIVIAPSHVTGILSQHLNKNVQALITQHIQKDLLNLPEHELLPYLQTNAQFTS